MNVCAICRESKARHTFYEQGVKGQNCSICRAKQRLESQFIEGEQWKDIPSFEGYEASTLGRIRNKQTTRLITPVKGCAGYAVSSLTGKNIKFHRIIAQTFIPNPENKQTVEHIDNDKMNNKLDNLLWATQAEQQLYIKQKSNGVPRKKHAVKFNNLNDLPDELWKPVNGHSKYFISSKGRLKYPLKKVQKITYGSTTGDGYRTFKLTSPDNTYNKAVHIIVAEAFLPNPLKLEIVNHKDGVKTNNAVENLEWCLRSQNVKHAYENNLIKPKRLIYQIDLNNNLVKTWNRYVNVVEHFKISQYLLRKALSGRSETLLGFKWSYALPN